MLYNLRNGKTVEISLERYLRMNDNDFQDLEAKGWGEDFNDPFFASLLQNPEEESQIIEEIEKSEDATEEIEISETELDLDMELIEE
jgi:hypothetical protein